MIMTSIERQAIIAAMHVFESYLDVAEMAMDDPTTAKAFLYFDRYEKAAHDPTILKKMSKDFQKDLAKAKPLIATNYRTLVSTFIKD